MSVSYWEHLSAKPSTFQWKICNGTKHNWLCSLAIDKGLKTFNFTWHLNQSMKYFRTIQGKEQWPNRERQNENQRQSI